MADLLKGKVAVVTGAGRGIGRGIALLMAAEGAKVVVNDLGCGVNGDGADPVVSRQVAEEIKAAGGTAVADSHGVETSAGGEAIIKNALDSFGRLDILVNVAGILLDRMIFNMGEVEWDTVIKTHLKGHFNTIKPASILMRQQRSGRIINFSSITGLWGNSGQANYGAAKGGTAGLTYVVAKDLGRYGITCNCISPGASTRMTDSVPENAPSALRAAVGMSVPSGAASPGQPPRPSGPVPGRNHPDDIAPMVVYLASDEAGYINGKVFHCSGGSISLFNEAEAARTIQRGSGIWTVEEITQLFPQTFGLDLVNPAPPQTVEQKR
ncbi:MAG: SDR family oxidoreductase [Dehalococcoidia bacterium]|nr:SDR family oxidoreductase [Dehalococcoidia bacterium]